MKKKILAVVLAVVILAVAAVGATLAWLMDTSDTVVNTFTLGNVTIDLNETTGTEYKLMPGAVHPKNPTITVDKDSENCYLFVKLDQFNGAVITSDPGAQETTYGESGVEAFDWVIAAGWTQLTDGEDNEVAGVYYRTIDVASDAFQAENGNKFTVLGDMNADGVNTTGEVIVNKDLTQSDIAAIQAAYDVESDATKLPSLTITAYAIQQDNLADAYTAWQKFGV